MKNDISVIKATSMLITSIFGVGIYYTPHSFALSGILVSIGLLGLVVLLSTLSIYFLFASANKKVFTETKLEACETEEARELNSPENPQQDITTIEPKINQTIVTSVDPDQTEIDIEHSNVVNQSVPQQTEESKISLYNLGTGINVYFGRLILGTIYITGIVACYFYQKFISKVSIAFYNIPESDENYDNIYTGIVVGHALILLLFSQIQNLAKISFFTYISVACMSLISISLCVMTAVFKDFRYQNDLSLARTGILQTLVNFIFAMGCQNIVVEIFSKLRVRTKRAFLIIASVASISSATIYGMIGIVGYALFGNNKLKGDIINALLDQKSNIREFIATNHPNFEFLPYLLGVLVITELSISSVFQMASVTRIIRLLMRRYKIADKYVVFTSTFTSISLITMINIFVKVGLETVFVLIGSLIYIPMALIFPFVFAYYYLGKISRLIKIASIIIIIFGSVLAILNTVLHFAQIDTFTNKTIETTAGMINETTPSIELN